MDSLSKLFDMFRNAAATQRGLGTAFEDFTRYYLTHDAVQGQQFVAIQTHGEWARSQNLPQTDTGVDLVATLADGSGFAAIQCKFYESDHQIDLSDLDGFIAASPSKYFARRILVDTAHPELGSNAAGRMDQISTRLTETDFRNSTIDWESYLAALNGSPTPTAAPAKKLPRPHQQEAIAAVTEGLATADRGKMIMACGTGKTFTSLKIAEQLAGRSGLVLFMVPSLALMAQSVREWSIDCALPLLCYAVCSDSDIGKKKRKAADDQPQLEESDLAFPATTDATKLAAQFHTAKQAGRTSDRLTVIFATYQSIQTISDAQQHHNLPVFDLIICDEAHRTTGVTIAGKSQDESEFTKIHNNDFIKGRKRLYMTATPRIYTDRAKKQAKEYQAETISMDDAALYGQTLYYLGFGEAVKLRLLTDYQVMVLAVDVQMVSTALQHRLTKGSELTLDDETKILGCYKALSNIDSDLPHMRRAVAFCRDIKTSELVKKEFAEVAREYNHHLAKLKQQPIPLSPELDHVDGSMGAKERGTKLDWLKSETDDATCRILTNARCLSEGVDVPSLDAILFLHARKSQIDVVQAVGRVMRRSAGKDKGYIILPVGIPAGKSPQEALRDNDKYKVVWQTLNALRAHDERINADLNQMSLGQDVSHKIKIIGMFDPSFYPPGLDGEGPDTITGRLPETTQVDAIANVQKLTSHVGTGESLKPPSDLTIQAGFEFQIDEVALALRARIVDMCSEPAAWDSWARDIAQIADSISTRLRTYLTEPNARHRAAFDSFLTELRSNLNQSIREDDAIEMLAQHWITKPVFDTLFAGVAFTAHNPVAKALTAVLDELNWTNLDAEIRSLNKFYDSVRTQAEGITDIKARQTLIIRLYDQFFKNAFPRTAARLGVVYTPIEVVDFILHSVNHVLQTEFGQSLGSPGVNIIDPFTGTGSFITRLLQSGLIKPDEMARKYRSEIHANEIILLAYYIAAVNIETTFESLSGTGEYQPFNGICLTDSFDLYENKSLLSGILPENSERLARQKQLKLKVVIGNPPYSVGQESGNDNNANTAYPALDGRIAETYVAGSAAINRGALYDSYIRAIRWASDRVGEAGVIGFITGSGFVERGFGDGLRACLRQEFTSLFIFHLRGDGRKNMLSKGLAKEGENIFGNASMTGAAISILVKNPQSPHGQNGKIFYCDIGDDLTTEAKKEIIAKLSSIASIAPHDHYPTVEDRNDPNFRQWRIINPDKHNDWLNQRDSNFENFISLGDKKNLNEVTVFDNYSRGLAVGRDPWCYNSNLEKLRQNIHSHMNYYNQQRLRWLQAKNNISTQRIEDFVSKDITKIKWSRALFNDAKHNIDQNIENGEFVKSLYRPFTTQWNYYSRQMIEMVYQMPKIFPEGKVENFAICTESPGSRSGFSVLMVNKIPDLHLMEAAQCFPLYLYEEKTEGKLNFSAAILGGRTRGDGEKYERKSAISTAALQKFQSHFNHDKITAEELFYYIYGVLHAPDYRAKYANNFTKELPRIPFAKSPKDFWDFVAAGRDLGQLHVNYESQPEFAAEVRGENGLLDRVELYRVERMRYINKDNRSRIRYNDHIEVAGIPPQAYDYIVNGKPAIEWVMERQARRVDKDSGIVNDANDYAVQTVGDPRYPLSLLLRVITVSVETQKIIRKLPELL
ncbi:MAG: DEAD/DEAH box helicase family protein [Candidatus Pacebacteria bacterium]|nr:DEAD/DEAH box helicase family protein [Candidatus Paceibacterota bacterium]